ncbi:MAG: ABC transporter permease [Thermoplasmatales archaeon]
MEIKFDSLVWKHHISGLAKTLRLITQNKKGAFGLATLTFYVIMAVFGPLMVSKSSVVFDLTKRYLPPSLEHPLGTDMFGRDNLAIIILGSPNILMIAFIGAFFTVGIGVLIGITAGFLEGAVDDTLMFAADILLTIPIYPLLIVLSAIIRRTLDPLTLGLLMGSTGWAGLSRAVRSQVLSLKEREFIEAAKILGLSRWHIIFREIMPNLAPYIAVSTIYSALGCMGASVGLFMIGLAPFDPYNWGYQINRALSVGLTTLLATRWGILSLITPTIFIILFTAALVFLVNSLEIVFNPRLRED